MKPKPQDNKEKVSGTFFAIQRAGDVHQQVTVEIEDGEIVSVKRSQPNFLDFIIEPARRELLLEALK